MKKKFLLALTFIMLFLSFFLHTICMNIDYIVWISHIRPTITIEQTPHKISYTFDPNLTFTATTYELLSKVNEVIRSHHYLRIHKFGKIEMYSFFSSDGYDYGGIPVTGPGLRITIDQKLNHENAISYINLPIYDIRHICGDTPKAKVCTYEYPFRKPSVTYYYLQLLRLTIVLELITIFYLGAFIVAKPRKKNSDTIK